MAEVPAAAAEAEKTTAEASSGETAASATIVAESPEAVGSGQQNDTGTGDPAAAVDQTSMQEPDKGEHVAPHAAEATPLADTAEGTALQPASAIDQTQVEETQGAAGAEATPADLAAAATMPGPPTPTASGAEQAPVSEEPQQLSQAALPAEPLEPQTPAQRPPPGLEGLASAELRDTEQETPAEAQQSIEAPREEQPATQQAQADLQAAPDDQPSEQTAASGLDAAAAEWAGQSDGMAQWLSQAADACAPQWSTDAGDGQNWGMHTADDHQWGENWQGDQQWSGQEWLQNQQDGEADLQEKHEQEWQAAAVMHQYQAQLAAASGTEVAGLGQATEHQEQVPTETQQPQWKQREQPPLPEGFNPPDAVDMLPDLKGGFGQMLKAERTLEHVEESTKKKAEGREARLEEITKLVDLDLEWLGENIANTTKTWETICEGMDVLSVEEEFRKLQAPCLETDMPTEAANPWADMTEDLEDTKEQEGLGHLWWRRCRDEAKKADDWSQWTDAGHEWGASNTGDGSQRADDNYQSHSSTHRGWESNSWDDNAWDKNHSADNSWEKPPKAASGRSSGNPNPWADMTSEQDESWQASADTGPHRSSGDAAWQEDTWQNGWQEGAAGDAAWQQDTDRWKEEPAHEAGRWPGSDAGHSMHRHPGVAGGDVAASGNSWGAGANGAAASYNAWGAGASDVAASNDAWIPGGGASGVAASNDNWGAGAGGAAASGDAWGHYKGVVKPHASESFMGAGAGANGRWLAGGCTGSSPPGRNPGVTINQVDPRVPRGCLGEGLPLRQPPVGVAMNQFNTPGLPGGGASGIAASNDNWGNVASSMQGRQPTGDRQDPWSQGGDPWGAQTRRPAVKSGQQPDERNPWQQMQHQ